MPDTTPDPTGSAPAQRSLCRSLTVGGRPCRATAVRGQVFCIRHAQHRHPVCPRGSKVVMPLLEDLETIQVVASQVAQGLLADTLDPARAARVLYACQIAALTLPRPARLPEPAKKEEPEPVTETFPGTDGELLGPAVNPLTAVTFDSFWSNNKFRYEQECERLGLPKPQTPADLPESGWLNPEDLDRINEQCAAGKIPYLVDDGYKDKLLELHLDADRRGLLPPLEQRECVYSPPFSCSGPGAEGSWRKPCDRCARERDEYQRLHPAPDPGLDLKASAQPSRPAIRDHAPDVKPVNIAKSRETRGFPRPNPRGGVPPQSMRLRHQASLYTRHASAAIDSSQTVPLSDISASHRKCVSEISVKVERVSACRAISSRKT